MCVNQRLITNPYTKRQLYVNCGKCPACLQEKAIHRVRRIKNTESDALECMMVSLTYSRGTAPYVDRSEAYNFAHARLPYLNVYRDSSFRRVRVGKSYDFEYRRTDGKNFVTRVDFYVSCDFDKTKDLKHETGKIGIAYYPDLQHFMARLRLNLKRLYSYDKRFLAYSCSEYGIKSLRPHFHLLFFYPKGDFEVLRSAIIKSWPFSDLQMWDRAIEKCFRGASYVASYVNNGSKFPDFFKTYFRPKHSYSKGFGLGNRFFSLRYILDAFKRNSLSYNSIKTDGKCQGVVTLPIPKYVIHRYFPQFSGYSRIAPSALYDNMRRLAKGEFDELNKAISPLYIDEKKCRAFCTRLNNAYKRCREECPDLIPDNFDEYYRLHINIWNLYHSNMIRFNMENQDLFLFEKYDNLDVVKSRIDSGDMKIPLGFSQSDFDNTDVNKYPHTVSRTIMLRDCYHQNIKHRSVTNAVLSSTSEEW